MCGVCIRLRGAHSICRHWTAPWSTEWTCGFNFAEQAFLDAAATGLAFHMDTQEALFH